MDPAFLAVHINAAFTRLTGIQNGTVIGRPVSNIIAWIEQLQSFPLKSKSQESITSSLEEANQPESSNDLPDMERKEATKTDTSSLSSSSNDNIAVAGIRVAKMEESEISIERLIALSGHGKYHKVQTLDIRVSTSASDICSNNESNNSSISSKDPPNNPTVCMMSVCPIMDSSSQHLQLTKRSTSPSNISPKRRKNAHTQFRRHLSPSHFVVQLFPLEEDQIINSGKVPADIDASAATGSQRDSVTDMPGGSSGSKALVACG